MRKKTEISGATIFDVPSPPTESKNTKELFREIRNYLAGQFVGATRDDTLLDEVLKCLFCKEALDQTKSYEDVLLLGDVQMSKKLRVIFSEIRQNYPDIFESDSELLLSPETLHFVMRKINFQIMDSDSDPVGDAYEVFAGAESRGNAGQFFTPRSVTSLLVEALDPRPNDIVLDPACGAGGFLISVINWFRKSGASDEDIQWWVENSCYGIDKDSYLSKLARAHIALATSKHPRIVCGDSLSLELSNGDSLSLPLGGVDIILTNPPFGTKIISARQDVLSTFDLARKWIRSKKSGKLVPSDILQKNVPPQILFVERCIKLLKAGGKLGMVVPESILSNKSYEHVVEYINNHLDLEAVLGMPEALFKTSGKGGTHTKTCLMVARKPDSKAKKETIFMAEAKWCGQDSRARSIPHNDLPEIARRLRVSRQDLPIIGSNVGFIINKSELSNNVLCPRYYDPQASDEVTLLKNSHTLITFGELVKNKSLSVSTGDEIGKLAYGTGTIPFIRTSDLSNWEIKADPKHGVSEEIFNKLRKKQDVRTNDILMVKDGTYLIGTCAIITDNDSDMLYQSHLYKIRVEENSLGLDSFLLLALLGSPIVQKQIRSKQFTQDIIDSLGGRINELVIPIPKDEKHRQQISHIVKRSVELRIEARELSKLARESISEPTNTYASRPAWVRRSSDGQEYNSSIALV